MLEVARRADEARDTHTGVAHASTTVGVEDVRRFFQSPVDAASGTVVVVEYDRVRAAFSCYHHRAVRHPRSSFARGRQSFSVRVFARPTSRSIEPASGRGQNYGPRRDSWKRKRPGGGSVLGHALHACSLLRTLIAPPTVPLS